MANLDISEETFDWRSPASWSPDSSDGGVGGVLRKVIPAYGQRIGEASKQLTKLLEAEARSASGGKSAVLRLTPKGGGRDTVESMSWVPKGFLDKDIAPEGLRSFGSPWLTAGIPGSSRIGPNSWPAPGMGQFLIQAKGSALVVTFPYAASLEQGASLAATEDWLVALPPASFNRLAKGSMQAGRLAENSVFWIPYGWVTILVNCTGQVEFPRTLVIPYLNAKLALGYPSIGLLVNFHIDHVKSNKEKGGTYWNQHGDSYMEWLGTLDVQEARQVDQDGTQVIPPPALMDGKAEDGDSGHRGNEVEAESESCN